MMYCQHVIIVEYIHHPARVNHPLTIHYPAYYPAAYQRNKQFHGKLISNEFINNISMSNDFITSYKLPLKKLS